MTVRNNPMVVPNDAYDSSSISPRVNPKGPTESLVTSLLYGYNLVPFLVNLYPPHLIPVSHRFPPPLISDSAYPALYSQPESVSNVNQIDPIHRFHHDKSGTNDRVKFDQPLSDSLSKPASEYHGLQQSRVHANRQLKLTPHHPVNGVEVTPRPVHANHKRRISESTKQSIIIDARKMMYTYDQMANKYGVSISAISIILKRNGIKPAHGRKGRPKQQLRLPEN